VYLLRNHSFRSTAAAVLRGVSRPLLALLWLSVVATAAAQELVPVQTLPPIDDDPGHFEVRTAVAELRDGVYFLTAWVEYRLSSEARAALESGVPLSIRLDMEISHNRRFWFDSDDADLRQLYQLEYHALSERYIVINVNSGDQASFASLFAALNYLGRIERLPIIDAALLEGGRDYELRLRAVLDVEQFPGPLRLLAFWRRDWSLASDWYQWPLLNN
jgi:Domain of unknown function (DUF4390)